MDEKAAPLDRDCRKMKLSKGSSSCYFKVNPCYKAQAEGSPVYYSHSITLESGKFDGMYLHVSPYTYESYNDIVGKSVAGAGGIPKCLRTGQVYEVNASAHRKTFSIFKHARFEASEKGLLKTGGPFRLFHPQSESFVQASCDQNKSVKQATANRPGDLPKHIPYLKGLNIVGNGEANPSNPRHHNAKGVWQLEPLTRTTRKTVPWKSPVRIRHVPSGCYLAINTSEPLGGSLQTEVDSYATYLVEDCMDEFESVFADQSYSATHANMIFYISPGDVLFGTHVPNADIFIRIEHHMKSSRKRTDNNNNDDDDNNNNNDDDNDVEVLYLSNTMIKKRMGSSLERSSYHHHLAFTSALSVEDIFRIIPVSEEEERNISLVKSLIVPCTLYVATVSNPHIPLGEEHRALIKVMLKLIQLQLKGELEELNWIEKANTTLPNAFSLLFDGSPNKEVQALCRDMKLLDLVFAMTSAPYERTFPENPWKSPDLVNVMIIQKFAYVALQRMCSQCNNNQLYFGKKRYHSVSNGSYSYVGQSDAGFEMTPEKFPLWMELLLDHVQDPLGSGVLLSQLLSANSNLLQKYATPKLLIRMMGLIKKLGPQSRLMQFFQAICTIKGKAVLNNQDMVLRLTWLNDERRKCLYLEMYQFKHEDVSPSLPQYDRVVLPSGTYSDMAPKPNFSQFPPNYLGKAQFEQKSSLDPVFLSWFSSPVKHTHTHTHTHTSA
jgi:hypothetical protein